MHWKIKSEKCYLWVCKQHCDSQWWQWTAEQLTNSRQPEDWRLMIGNGLTYSTYMTNKMNSQYLPFILLHRKHKQQVFAERQKCGEQNEIPIDGNKQNKMWNTELV